MLRPPFLHSTRILILALVASSTLALLAVAGLSSTDLRRVSQLEDQEVLEGISLIEGAYQLKTAAILEVLAVRDYALTGDPAFLNSARGDANLYLLTLTGIARLSNHPDDAKLLIDLHDLELQFEGFQGQIKALREKHLPQAAQELLVVAGKPLQDRWIGELGTLVARQEHHVQLEHHGVVQTENQILGVLAGVSGIAIPLSLLLGGLALLRLLAPLAELEKASRAIAGGRLEVRVPQHRDDEFGAVGSAFNTMADRVQASLQELTRANEELVALDLMKDEFLSMVSHELRTPLSFIKGFAGVLSAELAGPISAEQREYVGNINRGADRMLDLVNDLLDLATIQAGKLALQLEWAPIASVLDDVVSSMRPLADEKQLKLVTEVSPELALPFDRRRIEQVLVNLTANALRFTPAEGTISLKARRLGERLRVEVCDTGIGIKPEDVPKLFQRFSQLDMSITRSSGGTGLGLSISKALVAAHGGQIGVESTFGAGSTFWFELPMQQDSTGALEAFIPPS